MATIAPATPSTDEARWRDDAKLASVPQVDCDMLVAASSRAVIVAPHPDDEVLGCAGLMMHLARRGSPILLIAVSDGEHSHGSEATERVALLARVRPTETSAALLELGVSNIEIIRAQLPDSAVAQHRDKLLDLLVAYLAPGDTLFATWQLDGHPDHEAVGEVSHALALEHGCRLIEVPIWMWHWRPPEHVAIPWQRARKLMLDDDMQARKQAALRCFHSQLEVAHVDQAERDSAAPAILPPEVLAHFHRPFELFFV